MRPLKKYLIILVLFVMLTTLVSCKQHKNVKLNHVTMNSNYQIDSLFNKYDITNLENFGKLNPNAREETNQFNFFIGKYKCIDSLLINGKWKISNAIWETHDILNGYGVRDVYRNETYAGESIRFFNTKKKKWDVYFYGMPGEHTGLWEGEYIDKK